MTSDDRSLAVLGLIEFYIPLWAAFVYNYRTYKAVTECVSESLPGSHLADVCARLTLYPKILLFCWFFATINRIWAVIFEPILLLDILHSLFEPWQGVLNAIVYGMTDSNRDAIRAYFEGSPWSPLYKGEQAKISQLSDPLAEQELRLLRPGISHNPSNEADMRQSDIDIRNMMKFAQAD